MEQKFQVGSRVRLIRRSYGVSFGHTDVISLIKGDEAVLTDPPFTVELGALELIEAHPFKLVETVNSPTYPMLACKAAACKAMMKALCDRFVPGQPQATDKLPLINTNKLLTTIKLD